ncbi:uncharacterized protein CDAR_616071 [Caerostris darwini]|uniref:CCHC-type domain-containing protein n=1 Tax=Caerostris darwini TaxID=1538125 RepID=A0AAV4RXP3_9ARAC|nr:uncharacterized protein CDAR_616071 [Caerostris darwini]
MCAELPSLHPDTDIIPTKHLILTFSSTTLPSSFKADYLHCRVRPYIPNPLRCFHCQRFGHSQTACRGVQTYSNCFSTGHNHINCQSPPKCVNYHQSHQLFSVQLSF